MSRVKCHLESLPAKSHALCRRCNPAFVTSTVLIAPLSKAQDMTHSYHTDSAMFEGNALCVQSIATGGAAFLSGVKHLRLWMDQLGSGPEPMDWDISDLVRVAGSLPRLGSLVLEFREPALESDMM